MAQTVARALHQGGEIKITKILKPDGEYGFLVRHWDSGLCPAELEVMCSDWDVVLSLLAEIGDSEEAF